MFHGFQYPIFIETKLSLHFLSRSRCASSREAPSPFDFYLHPAAPQERILQLSLFRRFCLFLHTLHHVALANNLCCPFPNLPKPIRIRCDTCTPFDRERQIPDPSYLPPSIPVRHPAAFLIHIAIIIFLPFPIRPMLQAILQQNFQTVPQLKILLCMQ